MVTREVKDAKDLKTNELIYFRGHAQSTYMSDGNSVEDVINEIKKSGGGGDIDLTNYATITDLNTKADKSSLSTVATSGSYNDLRDKPTIPDTITEDIISGWGFTKNTGTVTNIKLNGAVKNPTNGIIDLGAIPNFELIDNSKSNRVVVETNSTFLLTKEVENELIIDYQNSKNVISTIIFKTGEIPPQISFYGRTEILWANNIVPIIESDTAYELSISPGFNYTSQVHVILTSFKPA